MFLRTKKKAEAAALTGAGATPMKKGLPSVISGDLNILGNLVSDGLVDVDGTIEGNVRADQITVRANGRVKGDVTAKTVHVYGEVQGVIRAQSVFLYSSCRIEGTVMYQSLFVEDGAFVDGKLKRMQDKVPTSFEMLSSLEDEEDELLDEKPPTLGNLRLIG